jgi:hypothetical protein
MEHNIKVLIERFDPATGDYDFEHQDVQETSLGDFLDLVQKIPVPAGDQIRFPAQIVTDLLIIRKKDEESVICERNQEGYNARRPAPISIADLSKKYPAHKKDLNKNTRTFPAKGHWRYFSAEFVISLYAVLINTAILALSMEVGTPSPIVVSLFVSLIVSGSIIFASSVHNAILVLRGERKVEVKRRVPYSDDFDAWDLTPTFLQVISVGILGIGFFLGIVALRSWNQNFVIVFQALLDLILVVLVIEGLLTLVLFGKQYRRTIRILREKKQSIEAKLMENLHAKPPSERS